MRLDRKIVAVAGGTGSLGKVLVRRLLSFEMGIPTKILIMSRDEGKQHQMRLDFLDSLAATDEIIYAERRRILEFIIGDVRDYSDVLSLVERSDVVFHAAALKQVPTCEYYPDQAVMTNCLGAINFVRALNECKSPPSDLIGISTDKACKPVNVMGMTKAIQERILISGCLRSDNTRIVQVRYGNVLTSRGSVVPMFLDQIRRGGPLTVTESQMTRFLLTLDQAIDTVFAAVRHAENGEIVVPNAVSASVRNIALALIGDKSLEIREIGIRPGEKMHEIMISEEEGPRVRKLDTFYAIQPMLPELRSDTLASGKLQEFSSGDNPLDLAGTIELFANNGLI